MSPVLVSFLVSMLPIAELRGGLPLGLSLGVRPPLAYLTSVLGNIIPVLPLLILFRYGMGLLRRHTWTRKLIDKWEERVEPRRELVCRYGIWGIILLVAIPLPITGAWTGALVSSLLSLRLRSAFLAICVGVCLAGVIVLLATIGIIGMKRFISGM